MQVGTRYRRIGPAWWPAILLCVVSGSALLTQWSLARPFWLDEQMVAINVRDREFADLTGVLWLDQSAPYGWLVLERTLFLLFGASELALRAGPVLFGVATLATALWIGRRWLGPLGAAVFVFLCGIGAWLSFHALELKPYSSDVFWALLLPGLAAWALEGAANVRRRRLTIWWMTAALGQWFGNGAVFVTPACAVSLLIVLASTQGWRTAVLDMALPSLAWLLVFGAHYVTVLQHTLESGALQEYWTFAFPPASAGPLERAGWTVDQMGPLAVKPGGSEWGWLFWLTCGLGLATLLRSQPALGLCLTLVPVSALLLGALRIVPLYERLSLWMVPPLYAGIAALVGMTWRHAYRAIIQRQAGRTLAAIPAAAAALLVCQDIAHYGWVEFAGRLRLAHSNHELDDRAGVRWLVAQQQPGDVFITTHLGLPAVWWYAGGNMDPSVRGMRTHNGAPVVRVSYRDEHGCLSGDLEQATAGQRRALLYFGFRDGMPTGFDELLFNRLGALGGLTAYREFAESGRAAVVDFGEPPTPIGPMGPVRGTAREGQLTALPTGCFDVLPAQRW